MINEDIPHMTTIWITTDDLKRIHSLKQERANRRKYEPKRDTNGDVVRKALDLLEEKTRISK